MITELLKMLGATALLGDAAWCASPVTGMGTSLAIVGAYILAGELKVPNGDHTVTFPRYEEEMRSFVKNCHKLADGVQWFCPTTPFTKIPKNRQTHDAFTDSYVDYGYLLNIT